MKTCRQFFHVRGFTLLELLVVIAIIAILAGLLFPVLARVRERANRIACGANLGEIQKAMAMYAMDHDDAYPTNLVTLVNFLESPELLKCRSDKWRKQAKSMDDIDASTADTYCSYVLFTRDADGAPIGAGSPSAMIVACDKNGISGDVTADGFGGNHNGDGGNVVYNGGAVRWIQIEKWTTNLWGNVDLSSAVGW